MGDEQRVVGAAPTRRALLLGLAGATAAAAAGELLLPRISPHAAAAPEAGIRPVVARSSIAGPPTTGIQLHLRRGTSMQGFLFEPHTGEWFVTQSVAGSSGFTDPAGLAVGDIVVSRLAEDGTLLDAMTLPDSGHGMGLIVRVEAGVRTVYSCWFAAGTAGTLYDVVRLPYAAGVADRRSATTVVAGLGYPLDPSYDSIADAVTVRHQGGSGPEYTRHHWSDFAAGDLSRPTGAVATSDRPPTHQGFVSRGDRFFFYSGAPSLQPGGDPPRITEHSWTTGSVVGNPIDASGLSRLPDGTYPGGGMEPEGATVVTDPDGSAALLVGVTNGGATTAPKTDHLFRYPLIRT